MSKRYPGGVVSATSPTVNAAGASGLFGLVEQAQSQAANKWPPFKIGNSLRFRGASTAYLNRTPASGNRTTWSLSFWVKSSVTGTYSVTFQNTTPVGNDSATRLYVAEYTILQTNVWEKKTITVNLATGSASGTWNKTNGGGLSICWNLGAESNRKGNTYLNTWGTQGSTPNVQSSSQVQWATNAGATFFLTGVQFEKGSTASSFDYRPFGTKLQLCQRYFEYGFTRSLTTVNFSGSYNPDHNWFTQFKVEKRSSPTVTRSNITDTQITFNGITPNVYGFTSEFDATVNGQNSSQFNFSANSEL
jgi:hypothetical protein